MFFIEWNSENLLERKDHSMLFILNASKEKWFKNIKALPVHLKSVLLVKKNRGKMESLNFDPKTMLDTFEHAHNAGATDPNDSEIH